MNYGHKTSTHENHLNKYSLKSALRIKMIA